MGECTVGKCQEKIGFFDLFMLNAMSFDMFNGMVKCLNALIQACNSFCGREEAGDVLYRDRMVKQSADSVRAGI